MKKFLALVCMITCIFGLTACGSEETLTAFEQQKIEYAKQLAAQNVAPLLVNFMDDANKDMFAENTPEEIAYTVANNYGLNADGYGFSGAIASFSSAKDEVGAITEIGEATAEIDGDQIIVIVQMTGEKKKAEAEVIFSNDMFMTLQSAALNPVSSMGEMMEKAVLNTLIGMGTVFVVLILISLIISGFSVIPKLQAKMSKKKQEDVKTKGVDNAVTQIAKQEEGVDTADDLELAAVIAAAVAASEGAASADGFVVRSIRKARR